MKKTVIFATMISLMFGISAYAEGNTSASAWSAGPGPTGTSVSQDLSAVCEQYKEIVLQENASDGSIGYKLFYLDDDDIPEMTVNKFGYWLKIVSSNGTGAFYIVQVDGDPILGYGTHGRDYICYERSGRIDTGANVGASTMYVPEYLYYDKATGTFVFSSYGESISGNYTELCLDDLSAKEMYRDLDLIAKGKQPMGKGGV
ncbi:hypothetical protein UYO_1667 [Lachnospiraceae bacterium JC7]|nr:hypothetical protein UYO_1667 [Lachnospiraceae bacterium JC7]